MMKRLFLFLITNIAVVATISILINILGLGHYITKAGIDYNALAIFCLVWGMTGSVISLLMSRQAAKWFMGVKVVDPRSPGQFAGLVNMVEQLSRAANLPKTPEVGVYESPEMNAFATGPSQSRSLVAFSTGILQGMNADEIAGVAGHEIAHIKNGDMVTMTLIQGVINAFVMFLSRVIGFAVSQSVEERSRYWVNTLVVLVLDIALTILGSIVVFWFSRQREFRADAGSAQIAGRGRMIAALKRLGQGRLLPDEHKSFATMKISGHSNGFAALFSSHPRLEARIAALERGAL